MLAWTDPVVSVPDHNTKSDEHQAEIQPPYRRRCPCQMLAKCFSVAQVLVWISAGMILVETIRYASFDWSIITGKRARRWPQIFYFGVKIMWYVYLCLNVVFVWGEHELDCRALMRAVELFMGLIAVASSVLLACRTVCIYQGRSRTIVSAVLTVGALAVTGTWMAGVDDVDIIWMVNGAQPWQDGGCAFVNIPSRYAVKYIVTVVFDFLVLILTTVGIIRMQGGSRLASLLFSQGLFYFAVVSAANLTVCILCLLQLSPVMSLIGAVPSSAVAVLASTRLYVDLAEAARPQTSVDSSQLSGGTGEKLASYFRRSSPMDSRHEVSIHQARKAPSFASQPPSPTKPFNTLGYQDTVTTKSFSNDESSDLESQSFPLSHPYASPTRVSTNATGVLTSSTGLPFVPSHRKAVESQNVGVGSGQKLAIAVERSCEIRSEVIPQDLNFVAQSEAEEEYPGLRRQSN